MRCTDIYPTWTGVSAPELPEVSEPLAPLLDLLVALVVLPGLLGEVGEHGGQRPPTDVIGPSLTPLVAANSWELANSLQLCFILGPFL